MELPRIDGGNRSSDAGGGNNAGILWDYDMQSWTWLDYRMKYSEQTTALFCFAYSVVFVTGIVGNISVVLVVFKNVRMRSSPTNIFIANLAVADLLVSVVCVPFTLFGSITDEWHLGLTICKLVPYFQGVSVNASIYTLMAISVERCWSICNPMKPVAKGMVKKTVGYIWIYALTITVPWAVFFNLQPIGEGSDHQICMETWPTVESSNAYFVVANLVLCYFFPLLVIGVCYSRIWKKVSGRKVPGEPMHNSADMVQRSKMKVINMIFYVVVLFAVSWLPLYLLFTVIKFFTLPPQVERCLIAALPVAQCLAVANSSINPLLYAIFNKRFRAGYRSLLSGNLCRAIDYSTSGKFFNNRAGTTIKRLKRNHGTAGGQGSAAAQGGTKPKIRKTIGAIYLHRDPADPTAEPELRQARLQLLEEPADPQPSRDDGATAAAGNRSAAGNKPAAGNRSAAGNRPATGNRPRSTSVKEPRATDEVADSVVQFCAKHSANTFV